MPFGFQTTQIHLNYWNSDDFLKFENLITKNYHKITTYDEMLNNINNGSNIIFRDLASLNARCAF